MSALLRPASLVAALLLAACTDASQQPTTADDLAAARARWRAANIRSYAYVSRHDCFCPAEVVQPLRAVVDDGQVVEVATVSGGRAMSLEWRKTVEGLFAVVEEEQRRRPDQLFVRFDAERGYPVRIEYGVKDVSVDGGGRIEVLSFEVR
ncbi:MAG: DUF6174 domain-containing protein [Gemmatimonadales bacterium]|nr:DUF6174 domain-containing protein [Gemmatimonadales bacterium]